MIQRLLVTLLLAAPAAAQDAPAADVTVEQLLEAVDDVGRGDSSIATIEMHVKTRRYERTMTMKAWAKGDEKSLIRILSPAKDAGITTLKVDDNLWNYLPKVDRTMKVPAGMMSGSWMGSHFSNDDLVRESRLSDDYTYTITGRPDAAGQGNYVVQLVPKPEAPVVWGKVEAEITPDRVPVAVRFYDEKDALVRTMTYAEVKELDGRRMPTVMKVVPADEPDEFTQMTFVEIDFEADVPEDLFSRQALEK